MSYPTTKVNDILSKPQILAFFTSYGCLDEPSGPQRGMFGGLWTKPDRLRYLRCVERAGIVDVTSNLNGAPAGLSGARNGRFGGFCGLPAINIARVVLHGREPPIRSDEYQKSKGEGLILRREGRMSTGTLAVRSSAATSIGQV